MSLKHQLLAAAFQPLRLRNTVLRRAMGKRGGRLRVLLYHDIAPADESRFAAQLSWLSRSWRFISPDEFSAIVSADLEVQEDCLMLTFDDGFASNRRVAETVLNPMGIKALFFVISKFVALSDKEDWRSFVAQNICYPTLQPNEVPSHWRNMTWSDLNYLLESGHSIGAHTAHHARLSQVPNENLVAEIILSADTLEKNLGSKILHFAYTFGDLASFSPAALAVAHTRFKFIYTGLRGINASGVPSWAIRRDAIAATDSLALMGALLEGGADWMYARSLAEYVSWGKRF
jgi:peptidoglycan/xylan/chitin deacetylase (PgdA/CDA1 family)